MGAKTVAGKARRARVRSYRGAGRRQRPPRYNRRHPYLLLERAMSTPAASAIEGANPSPQADATPLRFVTAASLFDGHAAALNIMRRLIQPPGAEVIPLGHNRSVEAAVRAARPEAAHATALSTHQGGPTPTNT